MGLFTTSGLFLFLCNSVVAVYNSRNFGKFYIFLITNSLRYCFYLARFKSPKYLFTFESLKNRTISEACDFQNDTCGWSSPPVNIWPGRSIGTCGFLGNLNRCYLTNQFQTGYSWTQRKIQRIGLPSRFSFYFVAQSNF